MVRRPVRIDVKQPCICGNYPIFKASKLTERAYVSEYRAKDKLK